MPQTARAPTRCWQIRLFSGFSLTASQIGALCSLIMLEAGLPCAPHIPTYTPSHTVKRACRCRCSHWPTSFMASQPRTFHRPLPGKSFLDCPILTLDSSTGQETTCCFGWPPPKCCTSQTCAWKALHVTRSSQGVWGKGRAFQLKMALAEKLNKHGCFVLAGPAIK